MARLWKSGEWFTEFRIYDVKDNERLVGSFDSIKDVAYELKRSIHAIQSAIQRNTNVRKRYRIVREKVYENE